MKVKKVHMIATALIFLFCCVFFWLNRKIEAYADEYVGFSKTPTEFEDNTEFKEEYDTFLEAYYTNLIDNMGYNVKGSCGYVALGMLLSYYDTYQSDSIIPEEYDCPSEDDIYSMLDPNMNNRHNSPGIYSDKLKKEDFSDYGVNYDYELSNEQYYEIIEGKADINSDKPSLHSKLLTIGHDLGYYGKLSSAMPGGTTPNMVTNVLNKYLTEIGFEENIDYTLSSKESLLFDSTDIRTFVKDNIQEGKPVLIGIKNGLDYANAHFCIAYDYDEVENEIYANFGWLKVNPQQHYQHQHTKVSNAYNDYFFALTIDFKMPHTHTNNYFVRRICDEGIVEGYYCWDNCNIITYKQREHEYTDHYDNNGLTHTAYCLCGASKVDMHNYTNFYAKYGSEEYHYAYCVCGEKKEEKHIWVREADSSGKVTFKRCKKCLYLIKLRDDEGIQVPIVKRDDEYEES